MRFVKKSRLVAIAVCVSSILSMVSVANAEVITVNTTDDHNDGACDVFSCTLREAILKANATVEADEILMNAGPVYELTVGGDDDSAFFGDLDIRSSDLIISGVGRTIIVNAAARAFDVDTFAEGITVEIRGVTIRSGGTGVRARASANLTLIDVTIEGMSGSGVFNSGTIELQRCTISNCNIGVLVDVFSTTTLRNCVVRDNVRTFPPGSHGAGVFVGPGATMNIFDSLIANNRAMRGGGGIYAPDTTLNVTDSRITGNRSSVVNTDGSGGGISASGSTVTITRCLIDHNVALSGVGGGILLTNTFYGDVFATITNTTISHNTAPAGGGIFAGGGAASVDLENCTITGNTSTLSMGGGIAFPVIAGPILRMHNTIVAGNTGLEGVPDCVGTITSLGYNLIGNADGCAMVGDTTGNQLNVNPMLGPLIDNGGSTHTHALLLGSPAIDAADPVNFPANDQRQFPRPVDGNDDQVALPDIGAFEWPADCNGNGIPDNFEVDTDGDDFIDACDGCPNDANKVAPGACGCGLPDIDSDGDGALDCHDICQGGDDNIDCDGDGTPDFCDTEPDCNGNGKSDVCDVDTSDPDGDGIVAADCNDNLIPDECEIDNGTATDCDLNGVVDSCEPDCNANGTVDACDVDETDPDGDLLVSGDCDANGVPDECQVDCNNNGVPDSCDVDPGDPDGDGIVSVDSNANGVPDECEDCDGNGILDECDLDATDPDGDGLVASDCNGTGIIDSCEISNGVSGDCNENLIPDECEFLSETIYDISAAQVVDVSACATHLLGNAASFGYTWMDATPGPVVEVTIELNMGVQCETAGTKHVTTLNGAEADMYVAPLRQCNCTSESIVVRVGADASNYLTGQENTFLLTGMPVGAVGFAPTGPLGPDVFGRVTVRFDNSAVVDMNDNGVLDVCDSPADIDGSGAVDLADFALLQPCVAGPGGGVLPGCEGADINGDGQVSLDDYGILQDNFNPPLP